MTVRRGVLTKVTAPASAEAFLRDAVTAEQAVRERTVHARPMPITGHNIAFAMSEMAGEVIDAIMRGYPEYVRNNGKRVDLELEVGDAFSQIASALITLDNERPTYHADITQYLAAKVSMALAGAQIMWQVGSGVQAKAGLQEAAAWLLELCRHLEIDPVQALAGSHQKTLRKHDRGVGNV